MPCQYTNSKGKVVTVALSDHAIRRYIQRRYYLDRCYLETGEAIALIEKSFNAATKLSDLSNEYRRRCKKHSGASIYFKNDGFVFVVENRVIVTVEIASKKKRWMN